MPFLHVEDALLEARRACSQTLFVTNWFIVSYKHVINRHYTRLLRVFNVVLCNWFSIYQFLSSLHCFSACHNSIPSYAASVIQVYYPRISLIRAIRSLLSQSTIGNNWLSSCKEIITTNSTHTLYFAFNSSYIKTQHKK